MIKPPEEEGSFYDYFVPFTTKKAIIFIVIIGLLVFFNSLFNPFQLDDFAQIINNPFINHLSNIPSFFLRGMAFSGAGGFKAFHMQYRPFYFSTYILLYHFFGTNPFPYHFLQLIMHVINTIVLFLIFKRFFKRGIAFLLSLVFLVHTINSEAVIYIADIQEVFFVFFGLLALSVVSMKKQTLLPFSRLVFMLSMLFFSLLTKETGILFCGVLSLYSFLFDRINCKRIIIGVVSVIGCYLFIRYLVSFSSTADINLSLIQRAMISTRILTMPKIVFYYLSTFILPMHLAVGQAWLVKQADFFNFFMPLVLDTFFLGSLTVYGFFLYKKQWKYFSLYVFFSIWLLLGLAMHMQLIPLDVTVADRYFYFPMIGLLGIIGIIITTALPQVIKSPALKQFFIYLSCIAIVVLSMLTIIRNSEWQTMLGLFTHDVKYAKSPLLDSYYGGLLILNGQFTNAKPYLEESIALDPQLGHNWNNLGVLYEHNKDYDKAKELYEKNIQLNSKRITSYIDVSYEGLAHIALTKENFQEAKSLSEIALKENPLNIHASEYLAIAEYQLGEKLEALRTITALYKRSPSAENQGLYLLIQSNKLSFPILQNSGDVIY